MLRRSFPALTLTFAAATLAAPAIARADAAAPPAAQPTEAKSSSPSVDVATAENAPLAGWHGGVFYMRDPGDNFRLHIQGRAQLDMYNYFGPGITDTALKSTFFVRRIRPELTGEIMGKWQWMLAGDFGATSNDNPRGTVETSAAAPGKPPTDTSGRYNSAQTVGIRALATDVFLNYHPCAFFNVQLGQYDAPFTMENRTSDKYIQFMERSLAVRALGIPTNKEIGVMLWGELPNKVFFYSLGAFNGDGQGRLSPDNRMDAMGRVFFHPLAPGKGALKDLQIGGSFRFGSRDPNYVNYDYSAMTTQGNVTFWSPIYGSSRGTTHVLPSGKQVGVAGELRIPIDIFDLTSEFVYINNGTRESLEGFQATNAERYGTMKGYSYYVQLGFWPLGNRDINGAPGYENPTHVDLAKADEAPKTALQLLAKWEQLSVDYDSASRIGTADASNIDGKIKVNAFSLGANYWVTKHVRLSINYVLNMFPDSAPVKATVKGGTAQTSDQRALGPAQGLPAGINDDARDNGHMVHELLLRAAIAL